MGRWVGASQCRPRGASRILVGIVAALVLLLLPAVGESAAPSPAAPSPSPSSGEPDGAWIRPEDVVLRADTLQRALESVGPSRQVRARIEQIDGDLTRLVPEIEAMVQHARGTGSRATSFVEIEDLRRELGAMEHALGGFEDVVGSEAKRSSEALDELSAARRVWLETRGRPETTAAGEVVQRRVAGSLESIDAMIREAQAWRRGVLELGDRVLDRRSAVAAARKRLQAAVALQWTTILAPSRSALWEEGFFGQLASEIPRVPAQLAAYADGTRAYLVRDPRPVVLQAVFALVLMAALRRIDRRPQGPPGGEAGAGPTIAHPYALAGLLSLLATPWVQPFAPQRLRHLFGVVALVLGSRIVLGVTGPSFLPEFGALFGVVLLDRFALAVAPLAAVARVASLGAVAIGIGLAIRLARRDGRTGASPWMRPVARAAAGGLVVAFLADVGGWVDLAALLGRGILTGAIVAVFLYAAATELEAVVVYALSLPALRRTRVFGYDTTLLRRRVRQGLRLLVVLLWIVLVLRSVGMYVTVVDAVRAFLVVGFSVGALSISVGTILAFLLTILMTVLTARTLTGVLEDDFYPRARLPRGVPIVLTTLARYVVYSVGFLVALAAAGIQLSQLTILLGGLGVGIGLGLQDLVKNFAAGLTLLLERRVHPGDVVQIPTQDIFGRVLSIGMRATLVRGWNGSEVVVPNADLIATAITNWTLSDRLCRLEVPVGVAYGTDPERVLALLVEVARGDTRLLANPPPVALFKGFGESSLDFELRAWTDRGVDERLGMTSDLAVAVHRALAAAEINIPFPQRDLHLASVSPEAGKVLAGARKE